MSQRYLILQRHAKAESNEPGHKDYHRALTREGKACAEFMGEQLQQDIDELALPAPYIVCSAATRTRETLQHIQKKLTSTTQNTQSFSDEIYGASTGDLLAIASQLPDDQPCAMIIGHNPSISALSSLLIDATPSLAFATTTYLIVEFNNLAKWDLISTTPGKALAYRLPHECGWEWHT